MNFLLLVFSVAFLCNGSNGLSKELVETFTELVMELGQKCIEEVHPSEEQIGKLISREMPTARDGFCVILCVYRNLKMQREDGSVNMEEVERGLQPVKDDDEDLYVKLKHNFEVCSSSAIKDDDPCIFTEHFMKCLEEEGKKNGVTLDILQE